MKNVVVGCVFGLVLSFAATGAFAAGHWKGISWYDPFGSCLVNGDNVMEIYTTSCGTRTCWGAAFYHLPKTIRTAGTPWIKVRLRDDGPDTPGPQVWLQNDTYGLPAAKGPWTQFGAWQGTETETYRISWWNHSTGRSRSVDTGIPRAPGEHTLLLGQRTNGAVDYWLDDKLVYSTDEIQPKCFGNIFLAGHRRPDSAADLVVFTDYQAGTDYAPPQN
jgi:hypothetical protein